ncbi:MAG: hypothetical protein FD125_2722 [bacterium]|nr:MAG: hypothetical protein FD125_2722 [bacterium]
MVRQGHRGGCEQSIARILAVPRFAGRRQTVTERLQMSSDDLGDFAPSFRSGLGKGFADLGPMVH